MKKKFRSVVEMILTILFIGISIFIIVEGYVYQTIIAYVLFFVFRAIYIRLRDGNPYKKHLLNCNRRAEESLLKLEIIKIESFSPALLPTDFFKVNSLKKLAEWRSEYKSLYADISLANPRSNFLRKKKFKVLQDFVKEYELTESTIHTESIKLYSK